MMCNPENCIEGSVVDRYCLNKPGSSRETWHVVIQIAEKHLPFRPGDSIGIWPKNPELNVAKLLTYFHLDPFSTTTDPRTKQTIPVSKFLSERVDLNRLSPRLAALLCQIAYSHEDRCRISSALATHENLEGYDVARFLLAYAPGGCPFQEIAERLLPMAPRLYSISSGPTQCPNRIDLTVARVHYDCNGLLRLGLCSNYLLSSPLHSSPLRLFHQPSKNFGFPTETDCPIVMVGAGTGIAPFRAFMQEVESGAVGPRPCWLFFGERKSATDFFYEQFWNEQISAGRLRMDLAFSQDQEHKIYVQHRMWEQRAELWKWLNDGASILVCGNAKTMAKDVDGCLANIAASEGNFSAEEALRFLRDLRRQGRYLRDIY
jgi:sulfite reductase (NADPH) flavoprotein alpha-component